ncbi:MAG: hypothetical protein K9L68_04550 [Spirochaetales bacterium]|nr:hypothetical protein [Spirochaetales bacterium]MCF7937847.1 hypothetical protein [Spirochaetales bacterium]
MHVLTIVIALLFFSGTGMIQAGESTECQAEEQYQVIPEDKLRHLGAGMAAGLTGWAGVVFGYSAGSAEAFSPGGSAEVLRWAAFSGIALSSAAGGLKEYLDSRKSGTVEAADFFFTMTGGVISSLFASGAGAAWFGSGNRSGSDEGMVAAGTAAGIALVLSMFSLWGWEETEQ